MTHLQLTRCLATLVLFTAVGAARTPVVGYTDNPPLVYRGKDGHAAGFVAEVLDAAAKRSGIELEWRLIPAGKNPLSETVDIWPGGVSTAERQKTFYTTRSWWSTGLLMVSREDFTSPDQLVGRIVTTTGDILPVLQAKLAGARLERAATHSSAVLAVCEGRAAAFVTDRIILERLLLRRPPECHGIDLSMMNLPGATLNLHILARPEWKQTADNLLKAIEQLQRDGTVARIAFRHPAIFGGSGAFLATLLEANHQNQLLRSALWLLAGALVIFGLALLWSYRQNEARRRTETELRVTNAALKETNSDLEQFNYAASHDLSEPLRNMSLYTELLQRRYAERLDKTGLDYLNVIRDGAHRLEQLLDGLRRYALLSKRVGTTSADSKAVLAEACVNLQPMLVETGAVVTTEGLPVVPLEPSWLLQIFQNLISNAIKYRGEETPQIHVTGERLHGYYRFSVQDNGIGIRPEYRERVFAVFKRLHGREVPGTGIGLAICRKIVERHGGRIWVESNNGNSGSTFSFTIPDTERKHNSAFVRARKQFKMRRTDTHP